MTPPRSGSAGPGRLRPLSVSADLTVDIDGAPGAVRVTGHGDRLTVAARYQASPFASLRIGRDAYGLGGAREALSVLTGGLSEAGVDVDVTVAGRRVASVGPHATSGALARAAGLGGVEIAAPPRRVQLALGALVAGIVAGLWWAARRR